MNNQLKEALVILRLKQVLARTGLSKTTLYNYMKEGNFPKQIQLTSKRSVGWLASEINDYIQARINESRNVVKGGV